MDFIAERAFWPDGGVSWVVVREDTFDLHVEATAFLAWLSGRDLSVNTQRVYAGRVALYLSYCCDVGAEWTKPEIPQLSSFLKWLINEPLPPRGQRSNLEPRFRSRGTANAVMTTVCEFLRFGATQGWVPAAAVTMLTTPKYLRCPPPGYDTGESGQFRTVQTRTLRFRVADAGYETLSAEQLAQMMAVTRHSRDKFLVGLLGCTGVRIGEALGLRREDMHLLSNSIALGCAVKGPHIHVRRRPDNVNGALAKSRFPRAIPVTDELVGLYSDYLYERQQVSAADDSDLVFVNLFAAPLGRPMSYSSAKGMFDRLARTAGFTARPHMLRHGTATRWIRAGVGRDVVKELLGHASDASMQPYIHPTDEEKRAAVERGAARQDGQP